MTAHIDARGMDFVQARKHAGRRLGDQNTRALLTEPVLEARGSGHRRPGQDPPRVPRRGQGQPSRRRPQASAEDDGGPGQRSDPPRILRPL